MRREEQEALAEAFPANPDLRPRRVRPSLTFWEATLVIGALRHYAGVYPNTPLTRALDKIDRAVRSSAADCYAEAVAKELAVR